MRLIWIVMLSFVFLVKDVSAEEAVVIDADAIGEQQNTPADVNLPSQMDTSTLSQDEANRDRILKGGKISVRQKTAIVKSQISDSNKQQGEVFLAENKVKQGVISLPSGLQYKILRPGSGKVPTESSVVACRVRGKLIDGTVFDQSDLKKPIVVSVSGFLPGLKEAVKLMSVGAQWQIVIPPQLAYGELGNRGVGSNAVLIYDIEIVSIK